MQRKIKVSSVFMKYANNPHPLDTILAGLITAVFISIPAVLLVAL